MSSFYHPVERKYTSPLRIPLKQVYSEKHDSPKQSVATEVFGENFVSIAQALRVFKTNADHVPSELSDTELSVLLKEFEESGHHVESHVLFPDFGHSIEDVHSQLGSQAFGEHFIEQCRDLEVNTQQRTEPEWRIIHRKGTRSFGNKHPVIRPLPERQIVYALHLFSALRHTSLSKNYYYGGTSSKKLYRTITTPAGTRTFFQGSYASPMFQIKDGVVYVTAESWNDCD